MLVPVSVESFLFAALVLSISIPSVLGQHLPYPKPRKVDQVDEYHGVKVADPYRWLEDDRSEETARWVEAENKVTFGYLDRIPYRSALKARLQALYNYPKYGIPQRTGEYYFYSKNDGLQNQSVIYMQKGLDGTPEVLIDPNKFSADGTVKLAGYSISKDGRYCAFGKSTGGSDWREYLVMEVATRKVLDDKVNWIKVSGVSWQGHGFYYSRYPEPGNAHELSSKNENHMVYFHRVGTDQKADQLIFEDKAHPLRFHQVGTTEDERFALLYVADPGTGKRGNAIYFRDITKPDSPFVPIVGEITDSEYGVVDNIGDKFLVLTNDNAPRKKILLWDPKKPGEWKEILPQQADPIDSASITGGKLFVVMSRDVANRAYVYDLNGKLENEIPMPGVGAAGGFNGNRDDKVAFYVYTTLNYPPTIFKYDIASKKSAVFRTPDIPGFNAERYETKEIFYNSKDGTRVPMFVVHKKGLRLDGSNPALLYGYGGFNIAESPSFNALRLALLEQGFVYASANIRGGSEYGEKWHEGGMKLNKQNVFDDFVAAAEWLVKNGYTSPEKLAVTGGSNGGLLVGAVINQRPDLFRAAVPQVGVMDMLRFHKFTIGWNWISDYGSVEKADEFKALYAYSPLHNIRAGVKYPATLITTADHDDRVVPAHSFKYAATLQEKASPDNPVLIRIDTKSGHGSSSTSKAIDLASDVYAFLLYNLGITPKL